MDQTKNSDIDLDTKEPTPVLVVSSEESAVCKNELSEKMSVFGAITANLPEHFEVLELLGQGGSGAVFKVRDKELAKIFAVKVLRSSFFDSDSQSRFEKEAGAAQMLTHANVVAVFNSGIGRNGAPYMVMEYLEGVDLEKMIKFEGCVDVPRAVDLFLQVADSLAYAHQRGIVHRDIKSSNIIVQKSGDGIEIAKIVDFGTAFETVSQEEMSRSGTGAAIGSPPYMSPEQCSGDDLDARTDIYSFGCVMYETLSGSTPFKGDNPVSQIVQHLKNKPPSLSKTSTAQKIPSSLESIIMRCLAKDRRDRYQSAYELKADLDRVARNEPLGFSIPVPKLRWPTRKRFWFALGIVALLITSIIGVRTGELWQKRVSNMASNFTMYHSYDRPYAPSIEDITTAQKLAVKYYAFGEYKLAIPLFQFAIEAIEQDDSDRADTSRLKQGLTRDYKLLEISMRALGRQKEFESFVKETRFKKASQSY
ncbi:MAG: serine/threonine protein kinase [Candidatus Obscuribacterales bacterium]|nr:serine/threonine protein kinase [Candidatus Obscuribacterales bacterium]